MNIWKVSQGGDHFNSEENDDLFKRHCVCVHPDTLAKGKSAVSQGQNFINVKEGDYFYLCYGNTRIRLFGMFTGNSQNSKLEGKHDWLEQKYELLFESVSEQKYKGPHHWWTPDDNSTFIKVDDNKEFEEFIFKPFFRKELKCIKIKKSMDTYKKILINNSNLILTGAPGTGKTYLAKQMAQQMIFGEIKENLNPEEENKFNEQCGFVQFHPSYDYTDFVEGLRPVQDEDGNVGFERKDGVFKTFCKNAVRSTFVGGCDNFDEVWDKLIAHLEDNPYIEIPLLTGARNIRIELNSYGTGLTERLYSSDGSIGMAEKIRGHSKFFTKEQLYNIYRGLKGVPSGGHDNYRKAIVGYLKKNMGLKDYSAGQENKNVEKYVFIIDEINRGEISKIFGELFFSIDPGYRGEKGRMQTQYQNIVEDGDIFKKGFYVPENVYIIGTMNDIDRSVESMDFAFRRRFAFKEIKADDRVEMLDELPQNGIAINRMKNLNKAIESIEGLSTAYHIGPAYFLKLKNYNGNFQQLWENHLEGLLREYLRGMQNLEEELKTLKAAYDNESDSDNGQQQE